MKEDALLITEDKDFGDLVMLHQLPIEAFYYCVSRMYTDGKVVRTLEVIITYGEELKDSFTVVDTRRVRL